MKTSLAAVSAFALAASTAQAALPPNFFDELVTSVGSPTALAFTPDGRMLITRQTGTLRVFDRDHAAPDASHHLRQQRHLHELRARPAGRGRRPRLRPNNFIYLFYTHRVDATSCNSSTTPRNRVSRFVLPASNVIDPATEVVLIDNMPSTNGNHNAGDVQFGRDGLLYVSVGDGGCDYVSGGGCGGSQRRLARPAHAHRQDPARHARRRHSGRQPVPGPRHRALQRDRRHDRRATGARRPSLGACATPSGSRSIPTPRARASSSTTSARPTARRSTWARPARTTAGTAGRGPSPTTRPARATPRRRAWSPRSTSTSTASRSRHHQPASCNAITGGAFVPNGLWPGLRRRLHLQRLHLRLDREALAAAPPFTAADFATNLGGDSAVTLTFGPRGGSQALYYTTYSVAAQIRRIYYDQTGNSPPTAVRRPCRCRARRRWP